MGLVHASPVFVQERATMPLSEYLSLYADLFVSRHDDYAMQLSNGRYRRVGKPLERIDLADHLLGVRTYGTYVTDAAGLCRFAVMDADTDDGLERLWVLHDTLAALGFFSYVEASRRGGHLWIFFVAPVLASQVRTWLLRYCPSDFELYPKQDEGKGVGSLIRLPLGVHLRSGKRYAFVERTAEGIQPVAASLDESLAWLLTIQRVQVPQEKQEPRRDDTRTSFSPPPLLRTLQPSGTAQTIREWCALHDPYALIARYVDLNTMGVGCCPFGWHHKQGQDTHASLKVYTPGVPGGYCWYCYTWEQGGSVFDFLRYYYGLDARSMWRRIQEEARSNVETSNR